MSGHRKHTFARWSFLIATACWCAATFASARAAENSSDKSYKLGDTINFGVNGNSERFRVSGWSQTEKEFTWTEAKGATVSLELPAVSGDLTLKAKLVGLIHEPELPYQPVEVYINGEKIADWQVSAPADFTAIIPQKIAATKKLTIELRTPKSTTPKALQMNDDARVLGIACFEMRISTN
jgi:hypothetical protein